MKLDAVLMLKKVGACDEWVRQAEGKTLRQLFDAAWDNANANETVYVSGLSWLAGQIDPLRNECYCNQCCDGSLLGLPFSAWVEAAEAYMRANV